MYISLLETMIWMRMIRKCLKWLIYGHRWIRSLFDMKWPFSSFSLFAQMNNCYKSSYQEVKVGIQLTCLTPKHSCAYFKPQPFKVFFTFIFSAKDISYTSLFWVLGCQVIICKTWLWTIVGNMFVRGTENLTVDHSR